MYVLNISTSETFGKKRTGHMAPGERKCIGRMELRGVGKQGLVLEREEKEASVVTPGSTSRCSGKSCLLEGGDSSSNCPS